MGPQIVVSAHTPVETTKPHKVGLRYAVLEVAVCLRFLNRMKGQIIQRKTEVRGIEVSLNIFLIYFVSGFRHVST